MLLYDVLITNPQKRPFTVLYSSKHRVGAWATLFDVFVAKKYVCNGVGGFCPHLVLF